MNSYRIILSPQVTEKSTTVADKHNQHIFKVQKDANKKQIRKAIEEIFEVSVLSVRTINVKGKKKLFNRIIGKRSDWKKAIIRLKEGDDIKLVDQ
ncbi:MAG: 50S ribosomal protein L23 [Gammaproteobacteria bacterium]|nr:MAG: 50S ribosomal protein L23 [Gammaproteobacteria bacterium]